MRRLKAKIQLTQLPRPVRSQKFFEPRAKAQLNVDVCEGSKYTYLDTCLTKATSKEYYILFRGGYTLNMYQESSPIVNK